MLKIFISYSNKDKHIAGELEKLFEEYKVLECFITQSKCIITGKERIRRWDI